MAKSHRIHQEQFLVPPGQPIHLSDYSTDYTGDFNEKRDAHAALSDDVSALAELQSKLWASKNYALIVILQALDAAGKDGTIKHVMSGVNPQGVQVHSFKAPSEEERLRHFLWRPMKVLPPAGTIAIFNRSYYEEVLVVRVHPEWLEPQWLPEHLRGSDDLWTSRYEEINQFEKFLTRSNTLLLKFFLHISREEQRKRFLARIEDSQKNWKFSTGDLEERGYWDAYQRAYEQMLSATSTHHAPWYVVPADKKWFARACVADILAAKLESLGLEYPKLDADQQKSLKTAKKQLENEGKS